MSMTKIKELLEMFGGHVQLHPRERVDDVLRAIVNTYKELPTCEILMVDDEFIPWYTFYIAEGDTSVDISIFGQRYPTRNLAEAQIEFWLPGVKQQ